MRGWIGRLAGLLVLLGGAAELSAQPFAPAGETDRVVYRHANLIDGTGSAIRRDMAVITRGAGIEEVLADSALTSAQLRGARVVDLTGRYLLPGLIDSHQHLATPPNRMRAEALLRRQVYSGVTTIRIMADDLRSIAELARAARVGEIIGPDIHFAAVIAGRSFFDDPRTHAISRGTPMEPGDTPWAQAIDDDTDLVRAIARASGTGARAIKLYANLTPEQLRRLSDEARRQGMLIWAHGMVFPTPPVDVIAARPDVISHTCYLAYQAVERRPQSYQERSPIDPAPFMAGDNPVMVRLFRQMSEQGIILDATLRVYREGDHRAAATGRPNHCTLPLAARLTAQAHRAGVLIAAGTDGETPREATYPALFDELELLVNEADFTPLEAIRAATQFGSMAVGEGSNVGVIAPSYAADMVVLARDPTADIANMRSVVFTVLRGRRYERRDYRPISRQEMPDRE